VNWKGVFYQRYQFDEHVTALEGANGAGKTTVMIAAYVVLLPDMSRLRFTNVGESGATGGDKGIWGRLGEPGRPSYAVMDFTLAKQKRLVAGVHLVRKSEPSVEPTPFMVLGLDEGVRLQDLLLVGRADAEVVPELPELRENAARLGGKLQVFASARDYFAALFEQGVTPLRLGTEEERSKLNDMLRTSMTGGISRALTTELRGFVLKEEQGLADTVQRMRANLEACRRTRHEVQESRRLQEEIGGVFEAGQAMFAAAYHATRERAAELSRLVANAEAEQTAATTAKGIAEAALLETKAELDRLDERRRRIDGERTRAREHLEKVSNALQAAGVVKERAGQHARATEAADAKRSVRDSTEAARKQRHTDVEQAQEDFRRATSGLADLRKGIEELHRRAAAHAQARRRLCEAQSALGGDILIETIGERIGLARDELMRVDRDRRALGTRLDDAIEHRQRHAEVILALRPLLAGLPAVDSSASEQAVLALRHHRAMADLARRLPDIERDLRDSSALADRQTAARAAAEQAGIQIGNRLAVDIVRDLLSDTDRDLEQARSQEQTANQAIAVVVDHDLPKLDRRRQVLDERIPRWHELTAVAYQLGEAAGVPVVDRVSLESARGTIASRLDAARSEERIARGSQEAFLAEERLLLASGGPFPAELLRLKDRLGADLVAAAFEDVAVGEAGALEARLGPLSQALVVDDVDEAVRSVSDRDPALPEVLLVGRDANLHAIAVAAEDDAGAAGSDVLVTESHGLRVSRVPNHPRLGRRAREAHATALRAQADRKGEEADQAGMRSRVLQRSLEHSDALLVDLAIWQAGDPTLEAATVRTEIAAAASQLERLRGEQVLHRQHIAEVTPKVGQLRKLLGEAFLLDPPDHCERAEQLTRDESAARAAKARCAAEASAADLVEREAAVLRTSPLSDTEVEEMRERHLALSTQRDGLDVGIEALEFVQANVRALEWADAAEQLSANSSIEPAVKRQVDDAEARLERADGHREDAEQQFALALEQFQDADGARRAAVQELEAAQSRLASFGVEVPSSVLVSAAEEEVKRLAREWSTIDQSRDEVLKREGTQSGEVRESEKRLKAADDHLATQRREAEPATRRWDDLRESATRHGLTRGLPEFPEIRGHVNLVVEAQTQEARLKERLGNAHGGSDLIQRRKGPRPSADFAVNVLELWVEVRDWLRRRLPAQVAEVDDPREALLRLRDQLVNLEQRLAQQEISLRGASEDIARGIEVQIRKARTQVSRLSSNLHGVSFGSIGGIRVRCEAVERMEQVLRALRSGEVQELLFQSSIPIEDAFDDIFRRFGGGGRTGGERLLDYREYVHLQVEIRRKSSGEEGWEVANPSRLSTGEAIGVGAALMMVVLTEWERDATLLRGKRTHGSLRFLFLDEANRLSQDNLGVLFDLCRTLDLQLLIAAPEVARAEGNTTYRLVRRTTGAGGEEVLVTGRRTKASA
jgi:chromosome partition protein MukB